MDFIVIVKSICQPLTIRILKNLTITTTDGDIDISRLELSLHALRIDSSAGTVQLNTVEAQILYLFTTSGNADIKSAIGLRTYKANNSGKLNVIYAEVTGDLSFYNKNDGIRVTLPADLEFEFEATTKNDSVFTTFQENVSINGRIATGTVGEHPTVTVKVETNNGNIEVKQ